MLYSQDDILLAHSLGVHGVAPSRFGLAGAWRAKPRSRLCGERRHNEAGAADPLPILGLRTVVEAERLLRRKAWAIHLTQAIGRILRP